MKLKQINLKSIVISGGLQTGPFGSQLKADEYVENGIPVIMPSDIRQGRLCASKAARVTLEKANRLSRHQILKGDVIFPRRGDLGRIGVAKEENAGWICGTGCLRARLKDDVSVDFIHQYVQLPEVKNWLEQNALGQTMLNISTSIIGELPLRLPSLEEQIKIAAILSTLDDAIKTMEGIIQELDLEYESLKNILCSGKARTGNFDKVWSRIKFSDIFHIEIGGTPSRNKPSLWDPFNSTVNRWISIADLRSKFLSDTKEYISDEGAKKSNVKLIPKGTVVMSFKLTIGRKAILLEDCFTNEAICAFIPKFKNNIHPDFLYHHLGHIRLENEVDQAVKGKTLNKEKLLRLEAYFPELQEQKYIAMVLNNLDLQKENLLRQLNLLNLEKQALMQQLLTGKRRVKVSEIEPLLVANKT